MGKAKRPHYDDTLPRDGGQALARLCPPYTFLIRDPQAQSAVNRIANRLRTGGAVEEEIGDPALGDPEAKPPAIFEPALVADRWHDGAVAGHGGDDAGACCERLYPAAVDIGFDA